MKNVISSLFTKISSLTKKAFFFFTILLSPFNPAQDYIRDFDGIAIETGLHWNWVQQIPSAVDSMRAAGVDVVRMEIDPVIYQTQITYLINKGLKVIPNKSRGLNYIHYYTDAKYCVWEAEGPSPDFSDAKLEYDINIMNKIIESDTLTYLKLDTSAAGIYDTLIEGPYYRQDLTYYSTITGEIDTVIYRAEFKLKLDTAGSIDTASSNTPLCIIQVTHSKAKFPNLLECTDVIVSAVLTRESFQPLGDWIYQRLTYWLPEIDCGTQMEEEIQQYRGSLDINSVVKRQGSSYIQFKLIWLGNPDYLVSIDKVTLSDFRGRDLMNPLTESIDSILSQANSLGTNSHVLAGWLGFDEPTSLDIFEPIKKVSEILDDNSQPQQAHPLWIPWMGFWDGAFESRANIFGAMGLSPWDEFKKRVGRASIVQDGYLYDSPCWDGRNIEICLGDDYRAINIRRMSELLYKQAYNLDPYFGASIQCGAIDPGYGPGSVQRNVAAHEVLYNINLALMHGAKFLSLYTFFAQRDTSMVASGLTYHGIIDFYPFPLGPNTEVFYTDKYEMMYYALNPRLKGLFGKTIKHLVPASLKFLGKDILVNPDYSSFYSYIDFIEAAGGQADTCVVDLGLFTDPADNLAKYFMIINRYYSTVSNMTIGLKELSDYKNWQITDLMDTSGLSLVAQNNRVEFDDTIIRGDAKFYSVLPVIRAGGILATDDTVFTSTTLTDNMTINDSVTLTVNSNYIIKDTVTLTGSGLIDGTGYIDLQSNGKIIISNWDRSLFKGRSGNHPKLIWAEHPTIGNVEQYKIYRKKETPGFNLIKTISDTLAKEFIDTTVIILDNPHSNETVAEYYITAVYYEEESYAETNPSNTIRYQRVQGSGLDKKGTGEIVQNFEYKLEQNYPNPFNPSTVIKYSVKEAGMVELEILNILGERVKTLVNDIQPEGSYEIEFNAASLASGIYLYRLKVNDYLAVKKMILMK